MCGFVVVVLDGMLQRYVEMSIMAFLTMNILLLSPMSLVPRYWYILAAELLWSGHLLPLCDRKSPATRWTSGRAGAGGLLRVCTQSTIGNWAVRFFWVVFLYCSR